MADKWFVEDDILRLEALALVKAARALRTQPAGTRLQVTATQ